MSGKPSPSHPGRRRSWAESSVQPRVREFCRRASAGYPPHPAASSARIARARSRAGWWYCGNTRKSIRSARRAAAFVASTASSLRKTDSLPPDCEICAEQQQRRRWVAAALRKIRRRRPFGRFGDTAAQAVIAAVMGGGGGGCGGGDEGFAVWRARSGHRFSSELDTGSHSKNCADCVDLSAVEKRVKTKSRNSVAALICLTRKRRRWRARSAHSDIFSRPPAIENRLYAAADMTVRSASRRHADRGIWRSAPSSHIVE